MYADVNVGRNERTGTAAELEWVRFTGNPAAVWSGQIRRTDGRTVVRLAGEIDLTGAAALQDLLLARLPSFGSVEVDVADVTFIDSAAVKCLVDVRNTAVATGCRFTLLRPSAHMRRVLSIIGVLADLTGSPDPLG